jgi:phosphate transport system protein
MTRHLDDDLAALKRQLIKMSAFAETMINDALKVLVNRDDSFAPAVRQHEQQVNLMQIEIDEQCLELIALHQPAAGDLRFIMGAAKTNSELERLADQAVTICNRARQLLGSPQLKQFDIITHMAAVAKEMLRDSLHAFLDNDACKAHIVLERDDELDALKVEVTTELTDYMTKDPSTVERAITILLIARSLERIGDHATNIAENAIFVVEGKDVRHNIITKQEARFRT